MARDGFRGRERSLCDLVLFGSLDFSDVDAGSAPRVAVLKKRDTTRIRDLHPFVSLTTQNATGIPTT
jgi:hypothetical protein